MIYAVYEAAETGEYVSVTLNEKDRFERIRYEGNPKRFYVLDKDVWHRLGCELGPAWISEDTICWFKSGQYHNTKGPAVIATNGLTECWVDGERKESVMNNSDVVVYLNLEQNAATRPLAIYLTHDNYDRVFDTDEFGKYLIKLDTGIYPVDRKDGPAIEEKNGGRYHWIQNGFLHRIDGPAWTSEAPLNEEYWVFGHEISKKTLVENKEYFVRLNEYLKTRPEVWHEMAPMFNSRLRLARCIRNNTVFLRTGTKYSHQKLDSFLEKEPEAKEASTSSSTDSWGLPVAMLALAGILGATATVKANKPKHQQKSKVIEVNETVDIGKI